MLKCKECGREFADNELFCSEDGSRLIKKLESIPEPQVQPVPLAATDALLKRVAIFLEDGEWERADEYCERVLDIDPENAKAYIGKLCAELKIKDEADLANHTKPVDNLPHYKKALRFADTGYRVKLEGYNNNTFADPRDGQVYRTVKIGNQIWMAQNLNYNAPGCKCYDNDPKNAEKYGRLYNWEIAKNVAPPGWHLPSDAEWHTLVDFIGGGEGTKLKAKNGWDGTDDYGFSALPGGFCNSDGRFYDVGDYGRWWSATEDDAGDAWGRYMGSYGSDVYLYNFFKSYLFSVRLLKD
ncbi:MAG: fibrobacter succinogenes major paralogous domain-containing protein [Fibromonadales bacterium]|nr:fibrobacter succinogenes major paralogous domain-containing protein [Fibromonadales bacterium]